MTAAAVRRASIEGLRLYERGQYDAARATLERALGLRPDDVATLYRRGLVARATNESARAIAAFDRACASAPGDHPTFVAEACIARAEIAALSHDARLARAMYERAASIFGAHEARRAEAARRARAARDAATR